PEQRSTISLQPRSRGRADPDFPGSAASGYSWGRPVTPEAAGSSPVDPANLRSHLTESELRLASQASSFLHSKVVRRSREAKADRTGFCLVTPTDARPTPAEIWDRGSGSTGAGNCDALQGG